MWGMLLDLDPVVLYLAFSVGVQYILGSRRRRELPTSAVKVGCVSKITIYPFKGSSGVDISEADCLHSGITWNGILDRQWAVIDPKGRLTSSSGSYKLSTITPSIEQHCLCLDAPGMETLRLPYEMSPNSPQIKCVMAHMKSSIKAYDCGDEASSWIDQLLQDGVNHRVVYHSPALSKRQVELARKPGLRMDPQPGPADKIGFQNERPFLLGTDASLHDLNSRLEEPISMKRFRPNFVIESYCPAFDEDNWNEIFIGSSKFTTFQLCDRCAVTTVVPVKAISDPRGEPLTTLRKYRKLVNGGPCFCTCLLAEIPGKVAVGDAVYAIKHSSIINF